MSPLLNRFDKYKLFLPLIVLLLLSLTAWCALKAPQLRLILPVVAGVLTYLFWKARVKEVAAEKALKGSERRFRELVSFLPQPVIEMDRRGMITFANHTAFQYFLYKHEDFEHGVPALATIAAADQERARSDFKRVLAGDLLSPVEYRMCREEGEEFPAIIYSSPVIDAGAVVGMRSLVVDITELRQADEALRLSEETLRAVFNSSYDAMILHDQGGKILDVNEQTLTTFAISAGEAKKFSFSKDLSGDQQKAGTLPDFWQKTLAGEPQFFEWDCRRPGDGSHFYAEVFLRKIPMKNGDALLVNIRDISERKESETRLRDNHRRLNYLAYHDTLTSLPNRLLLHDRLQHAMAKARRSNCQVSLLFLDLDRFKNINDTLGHDVGDRLLVEMAGRLLECVGDGDTVARRGGDEFIIILAEVYSARQMIQVAEKIQRALSEPILLEEHRLYVTSSIGISTFPANSTTVDGLMKCADVAMYRAKAEGRNTYQFYVPEMNARDREFLLLESNLRQALEQNQLLLYYQPQLDMVGREMIGVEALIRWLHPEQGLIPPDDFIPLAEETGLIVPIGEWVLRTACAQARRWQEQGYAPVKMAVNVSARQFRQPDLVQVVDRALADSALAPEYLELELTESLIVEDGGDTLLTMTEFRSRGISLAIDDFGTGYSSLSYLKNLPVSKLKIDRSFLRDVTAASGDTSIAAAVIALAHSLKLSVLAEGVESEEQIAFLLEKGCLEGQGYYFSHPQPAEAIEHFLKKAD